MVDIATTIWQLTDGNGEFDTTGVNFIVDPQGNFIVDPQGNFIVDTGQTFTQIPSTVWLESDGTM